MGRALASRRSGEVGEYFNGAMLTEIASFAVAVTRLRSPGLTEWAILSAPDRYLATLPRRQGVAREHLEYVLSHYNRSVHRWQTIVRGWIRHR
jgi:hypothetical protein